MVKRGEVVAKWGWARRPQQSWKLLCCSSEDNMRGTLLQRVFAVKVYFSNNSSSWFEVTSRQWRTRLIYLPVIYIYIYYGNALRQRFLNITLLCGREWPESQVDMLERVEGKFRNRLHQWIENGGQQLQDILFKSTWLHDLKL